MSKRTNRIYYLLLVFVISSLGVLFVLKALEDNIIFFYTPTELLDPKINTEKKIRIGGMVKENSILKLDNLKITFIVTDLENDTPVSYKGILPDLFREGQGVVAEGKFANGFFLADKIIAKHDENYMPYEIFEKK
ncbi:cytochrome c maturation protein CcmE [Hyphomicrobiales bacterium]|jgi:cytochrome c-type biogenesis protein CcmE|nr:cytochrome c maturation protein CcmE [Rhodobiaceae bacterium]MDB4128139.1 cytochrome c maturation protein CcmE [Hyphomicrobiales bacterium]|tara:strand:+ start:65 stop:469 length:405 start_codon:yes stop_codon:yes gene_type:complete